MIYKPQRKTEAPIPTEHQEQAAVVAWVDLQAKVHPSLGLHLRFATPNGARRSIWEAAQKKTEGMHRGVPDLCFPVARNGHHGLWIEMKRRKGGVLSPEQREYLDALDAFGHFAVVCRGADEAIRVIAEYFGLEVT